MGRQRCQYRLFRRKAKKGRPVFHVRFIDVETGRVTKTLSTGETNQFRAAQWLERHLHKTESRDPPTLAAISDGFWAPDGVHARGRRARGFTISATHLTISEGYARNHLLPKWGSIRVDRLTAGKIDKWILDLHRKGDLAPATINKILQCMRSMLDGAVAEGHISENPAARVKPLRATHRKRGVLSNDEVKRLFSSPDHFADFRHYVINLLAFTTGARMGEVRGLTLDHVHPDRIEIVQAWEQGHGMKPPKYNSVRAVPIGAGVYSALRRVIDETRPQSIVFYSLHDPAKPMSKSFIEQRLYDAIINMMLPEDQRGDRQKRDEARESIRARGITFHSWRHKLNPVLRAKGVPDAKIRLLTGHSSEEMTDWYTKFQAEDFAEVVEVQMLLLSAG